MQISCKIEKSTKKIPQGFFYFFCVTAYLHVLIQHRYINRNITRLLEKYTEWNKRRKLELIVVIIDREKDWEKMDGQHRDKQKECEMTDNHKNSKKEEWYQGTDRKSTKNK